MSGQPSDNEWITVPAHPQKRAGGGNFRTLVRTVPAARRTYDGVVYDSRDEMLRAIMLDTLLRGGAIKRWRRQIRLSLCNGVVVYRPDFEVTYCDRSRRFEEVKGYVVPRKMSVRGVKIKTGKLKVGDPKWVTYRRAWLEDGPAELVVITLRGRGAGRRWVIVDRVIPKPRQLKFTVS